VKIPISFLQQISLLTNQITNSLSMVVYPMLHLLMTLIVLQ